MLARFALRDALVLGVTGLAWWALAGHSAGAGPGADLAGLLTGLLFGASAYVLHEWGHLLAGLAAGSVVQMNRNLRSPLSFRFDPEKNTLARFVILSLGGFAATAAAVGVASGLLPDDLLATRVARGAVGVLAVLALVLELPLLLLGVARGRVPREAAVRVSVLPGEGAATQAAGRTP